MNNDTSSSSSNLDGSGKKVRKPYTITKSRESWTDEEHDKFLEALQLFDRDWKKIEDFVGSKTVIQIRSHAQKYFLKVQKNGTSAHVPPPRPKRKAAHPYPHKAPKNVLLPLQASTAYRSSTVNSLHSGGVMTSENEFNLVEADIGPKGYLGSSPRAPPSSEFTMHNEQVSAVHGIPDFAEVYNFIGSVFDPRSKGHVLKLKEMDPINFETILLLMRNLSINLSNLDFEPIKDVLSSYDVSTQSVGLISAE